MYSSSCVTHSIEFLLNVIRVSLELTSLFFERVGPLFQLIQRSGCGLKFTIQRLQRLPFIDSEDVGIGFPVVESGESRGLGRGDLQSPVFP